MDSFHPGFGHPFYASNAVPMNDEHRWNYDRIMRADSIYGPAPSRSSSGSTIQRFLDEPERLMFTPGSWNDYERVHSTPSVQYGSPTFMDATPYPYAIPQRYTSPSTSGPTSSYLSSSLSDRHSTPWSSPGPKDHTYPSEAAYVDSIPYPNGGHHTGETYRRDVDTPCGVALHEVQNYADTQPEHVIFDDDHVIDHSAYYASYDAEEGYHPIEPHDEPPVKLTVNKSGSAYIGKEGSNSPRLRRRRQQTTRAVTSPNVSSKVSKRSADRKRSASYQSKTLVSNGDGHSLAQSNRAFPCPFTVYGCSSSFGSKNEWKRHVNTQHMRLGYWRCDQCEQDTCKLNDFNRKDLFIQHVRRMHPPETKKPTKSTKIVNPRSASAKNDPDEQALAIAANKCFRRIRTAPEQGGCLFCDMEFNGATAWDERLEHIGRHMESMRKAEDNQVNPREWRKDSLLEDWLSREEIIVDSDKGWTLADSQK